MTSVIVVRLDVKIDSVPFRIDLAIDVVILTVFPHDQVINLLSLLKAKMYIANMGNIEE